jgi:hypothetical protein
MQELANTDPNDRRPRRMTAVLAAPRRWLAILVLPDRALPSAVGEGRFVGPMLIATLAGVLAALTIAARVDLTDKVMGPPTPAASASGPGAAAPAEPGPSEHEIEEGLAKARAVEQVTRALAAAALPAELLALALALYVIARYVGGKPTLRRALALASSAALPMAVRSLLEIAAAARRVVIAPSEAGSLILPLPGGPSPLMRLLGGLDPFVIWSVALLVIGMPALAGVSRRRALVTVSVCFVLWLVLTRLVAGVPSNPGAPT